ncbi:hypothetical protein ACLX1H_003860 [Fusarium chlamydosporum]
MVEDMFLEDLVNNDYDQATQLALLTVMVAIQGEMSDVRISKSRIPGLSMELGTNYFQDEYYAEHEGDEEWEEAQKAERATMEKLKSERNKGKEVEVEDEEEEEEDEEEEEEEEEEDFEEEYDDEEEETEESEEFEKSEDEESDEGSEWDSLFLLVHNMPAENEEPKLAKRKLILSRDDSPCPPPRPQPAKRQKLDPTTASNAPEAQNSGKYEPTPVTRKRSLITQDDTPATEVPFTKRQKIDPSAVTKTNETEDTEKEHETKSSVPSEWLAPHQKELQNTQLPGHLRALLGRLPVSELHREAQAFILGLKYLDPTYEALAKAAIDMGLRFSKTARNSEYKIVFQHMMKHPIQAVMYNACKQDEAQHILFWEKVQNVTGKEIPPERIKERREKRAKREAEAMARFNARKAAEEANRESQKLKEKYVSQIGEASKLPLKDKVANWLAEIVKAEGEQ